MDFGRRVLACATTWRRPTPPAPSPIVDYYVSPGGEGDYAEATTALITETLFPGGAAPSAKSLIFWLKDKGEDSPGNVMCAFRAGGGSSSLQVDVGGPDAAAALYDDDDTAGGSYALGAPNSAWGLVSVVYGASSFECSLNGVSQGSASYPPGDFALASTIQLFANDLGVGYSEGKIRNIHVFTRALSGAEISALYAAGPTHNIRTASGAWAGETALVSWDTAAVGGVVPNTGSGGACGLTLNGTVTSEVDP